MTACNDDVRVGKGLGGARTTSRSVKMQQKKLQKCEDSADSFAMLQKWKEERLSGLRGKHHQNRFPAFLPCNSQAPLAVAISAALAASALATQLHAEEPRSSQLEEIVVTSQRREQSIQEIPYNISALSGGDLSNLNITDFTALAHNVAGLTYIDRGFRDNSLNNGFIIRGINASGVEQGVPNAAQPTVSTYIGETPLFVPLYLNDIERVEVLRGPQGTLFGAGSLGGTVRFIPNKPDPKALSAVVRTGFGKTEDADGLNYKLEGTVNLPLSDTLALRASAGRIYRHGFIDAPGLYNLDANDVPIPANPSDPNSDAARHSQKDVNDEKLTFARLAARWQPSDKVDLGVTYQYQKQDSGGVRADSPNAPGLTRNQSGIFLNEPGKTEVDLLEATAVVDVGFASVTSSSSYYENKIDNQNDFSGFYLGTLAAYYGGFPRFAARNIQSTRDHAFSQEIRLASARKGPFDWLAGVYYLDQHFKTGTVESGLGLSEVIGTPVDERLFVVNRAFSFRDSALFGELTYHVNTRWQITGGVRGFDQRFSTTQRTLLPFCGAPCSGDGLDPLGGTFVPLTRTNKKDALFKVNTSFEFDKDTLVYFTRSEGFRRGGANALPTTGPIGADPSLLSYQPDTVTNWEVGLKGSLFSNRVQYSVAGFLVNWSNIQSFVTLLSGEAVVNAGKAKSSGIEAELRGFITDRLYATLGYSYTNAKLTQDFTLGSGVKGTNGDRLPGVPENALSLSVQYRQPIRDRISASYQINTAYTGNTVGEIDPSSSPYQKYDGFWLTNASASLNWHALEITAYANNLGNTRGVTSARSISGFGLDHSVAFVAMPRTVGINLSYSYGGR